MKIYDSVVIYSNNASSKLLSLLKKEMLSKNIKILNNKEERNYCEHSILELTVSKNYINVENKKLTIKEIFDNYMFVPNIFSSTTNLKSYQKQYAKYIKLKKTKAKKILNKNKYSKYFDKITGGIYISDEDYYLLDDSLLKEYIFTKKNNSYLYVISNENGFILRGCNTYYYLLSNKGKNDDVNIKHFEEFINNYNMYFIGILKILKFEKKNNNILLLSVLDNIRNFLLILINCFVMKNQDKEETLLFELTSSKYEYLLKDITKVYDLQLNIINNRKVNIYQICSILDKIINYKTIDEIKNTNICNFNKMLKSHRECDNFLENYITVRDYMNRDMKTKNYLAPLYGGIELPLLAHYIDSKVKVLYISLYGIYNERHKKVFDYKHELFNIKSKININSGFKCILCDDNMLTGKTIQYIIDSLILNDIYVNNILLVNHVNMNRIYQIIDNKTLFDLELVDKYFYGLYFDSKYSKIKQDSNIKNMYLDEFYLFDLSKEYICRYLYKNGIYSSESRINDYDVGD